MIPIHELLSRIHWDAEFARAEFEIGYLDRLQHRIIRVPLKEAVFAAEDHFAFRVCDENGEEHAIPLHRIKEVYRDGQLIWHREH